MNGPVVDAFMFKDVPGTVIVSVTAFKKNPQLPADAYENTGMSLADARKRLGGDEGVVRDGLKGLAHQISLRQWANADPDTTFIRIAFRFEPS